MLQEALSSLPHGPEFRFIDALTDLTPGAGAAGTHLLQPDAPYFAGHFPGRALFPAVLMIEAIAQLAGIAAQCDPAHPPLDDLRLTAVRGIKVFGTATPGETLVIEAEVQGRMGNLIQATGRVKHGGQVLAEGQITLSGAAR